MIVELKRHVPSHVQVSTDLASIPDADSELLPAAVLDRRCIFTGNSQRLNYSSSGIIFLRIGAPGKNFMMCSADALKPQLGDKLVFQRGAVSRPAVASSLLSLLGRLCSAFAFVRLGQRDISPL